MKCCAIPERGDYKERQTYSASWLVLASFPWCLAAVHPNSMSDQHAHITSLVDYQQASVMGSTCILCLPLFYLVLYCCSPPTPSLTKPCSLIVVESYIVLLLKNSHCPALEKGRGAGTCMHWVEHSWKPLKPSTEPFASSEPSFATPVIVN